MGGFIEVFTAWHIVLLYNPIVAVSVIYIYPLLILLCCCFYYRSVAIVVFCSNIIELGLGIASSNQKQGEKINIWILLS